LREKCFRTGHRFFMFEVIKKENKMKKALLIAFCMLLGTGIFFTVNNAARARVIYTAVGELPNIPGCPLHESCVKALYAEQTALTPRFPAVITGGIAGMGAAILMGAAFLIIERKRRRYAAAI
jgi:hypothetical protein